MIRVLAFGWEDGLHFEMMLKAVEASAGLIA
jgi:hypothetical protein